MWNTAAPVKLAQVNAPAFVMPMPPIAGRARFNGFYRVTFGSKSGTLSITDTGGTLMVDGKTYKSTFLNATLNTMIAGFSDGKVNVTGSFYPAGPTSLAGTARMGDGAPNAFLAER